MNNNKSISLRITDEQKHNIDLLKEELSKKIGLSVSTKSLIVYALNELGKEYNVRV